jgi:hypothetical protein
MSLLLECAVKGDIRLVEIGPIGMTFTTIYSSLYVLMCKLTG